MLSIQCPSQADLHALAAGMLDEASLEQITAHVETCIDCQLYLENAASLNFDPILTGLRCSNAFDAFLGEPEFQQNLDRISDLFSNRSSIPTRNGEAKSKNAAAEITPRLHDGETLSPSGIKMAPLPEQFGRFRIIRLLGKGGMGAVYLAHDPQLDRRIALKIPRVVADAEPEVVERFYRESRAAAKLQHPNICPVYEVGEIGGVQYIVMAYVEGEPLSEFLRRQGAMPSRDAAALIKTIALALAEAHELGVIHRDLKPSNIMMSKRGDPIIMDFGLALQLNQPDDPRMTKLGTIVGTPAYMAPEQILGEPSDISASTDIYSLGVILFELMTGRTPFLGNSSEIMSQVLKNDPPSATELRDRVDPELESICLHMLSKLPADRYSTMASVAAALKTYALGKSDSCTSDTVLIESPVVVKSSVGATIAMSQLMTDEVPRRTKSFRNWIVSVVVLACTMLAAAASMLAQQKAGNVTVRIDGTVASDLKVLVDEKELAFANMEEVLELEPGPHQWSVLRGDWLVRRDDFVVAEGHGTNVAITLIEAPASESVPAPKHEIVRSHTAEGKIVDFALLPGGGSLLYATKDKIRLWDYVKGGEAKAVDFTGPDPIRALACDPAGKFLAVGLNSKILVVELSTGKEIKSLPHGGTMAKLAYSPDGAILAAVFRDDTTTLWNVAADYKPADLPESARDGSTLAFSPDGAFLATAHRDRFVQLWNVKTNELERTFQPKVKFVRGVTFSPDGSTLLVTDSEKIRRWSVKDGSEQKALAGHADTALTASVHPSGNQLVTGGTDQTLRFWDLKTGTELDRRQYDDMVNAVAFSPDGQLLLDSTGSTIHVWLLPISAILPNKPGNLATLTGHAGSVNTVTFSPDGRLLLSGSTQPKPVAGDSDLRLWDVAARKVVRTFASKVEGPLKAKFSSDGKIVAALSMNGYFQFWDASTGERLHSFDGVGFGTIGSGTALDFDFIPGRRQLVVVGSNGHSIIRLDDLKIVSHWKAYDETVDAVAAYSDGRTSWLVSGSKATGMIRAWSIPLVTESYALSVPANVLDLIRVTPDGRYGITGARSTYTLWNLNRRLPQNEWQQLAPNGPSFQQGVAAITPDGTRVLLGTQSSPPTIVVFDAASGDLIQEFPGHTGFAPGVIAVSPDGRLAASGGDDGKIILSTPKEKIDSERRAAEWVLSIAGRLSIKQIHGEIQDPAKLPAGPIECNSINLDNNHQVTDDGLKNVNGLPKLTILRLVNTPVTDSGINNLKGLPSLDYLNLEGMAVTDSGLANLRDFTRLRILNLTKTKITGRGLSHLAGLTELRVLYLSGTELTDEYLPFLEALPNLQDLYLMQTQVSDKGIEHLKRLEQLQVLGLKGSRVTAAGVQELQKARPQLKIMPLE